ncbi:MAG: glutamate racemase [Sphingorhabdus sp.]
MDQNRRATNSQSLIRPESPLLIFDSGIGGLSVLGRIRRTLPMAPIVYAADYAGLPYGAKSETEIASRVPALLGRLVERYRPRLIVIACNTACTIALPHVRAALDIPVVGTIPAIKPAALATKTGIFGLLGTAATIRQPYIDKLESEFAGGKLLLRYAAPELVTAAEAKMRGDTPDASIFDGAITGLIESDPDGRRIDVTILGCTHFPLVQTELEDAAVNQMGPTHPIGFVDGAHGIARRVATLVEGQPWPDRKIAGKFVTTGNVAEMRPYKAALQRYDLMQIDAL